MTTLLAVRGARWLALGVAVAAFALTPMTKAAATGGGVENFTVNGSWSCTSNCSLRGAWGIEGRASTCLETEAELAGTVDVAPAIPCSGAYFTGTVNSVCVLNTCTEQGQVDFYLPDTSDPGTTVGPISVGIVGAAQLVTVNVGTVREQGYVLAASFEAVNQSAGPDQSSVGAGALVGTGCSGSPFGCETPQTFAATITGVTVSS